MMSRLTLVLAVVASIGVTGTYACDTEAMMACVQPFMGAGMSGDSGPTTEQIHQMCSAMRNLQPCMEAAGCAANMGQYSAMIEQSTGMCDSIGAGNQGNQGSSCNFMDAAKCMADFNPSNSADCSVMSRMDNCLSGAHCTLEEMVSLSGQDVDTKPIDDARAKCSGAATLALSSLLMAAVAMVMLM